MIVGIRFFKYIIFAYGVALSFNNFAQDQSIYIICTAALIQDQFEMRKQEYIASCNRLIQFGFQPYIFESCAQGPTFLDDYSGNVIYTKTNNYALRNKGVNEAAAMLEGFKHFVFDSKDMIIKLTGRYLFEDDSFIKLVEENPDVDAFVTYDEHGHVCAGCFAMRYSYLEKFLKSIDLVSMERNMVGIEVLITRYIERIALSGATIIRVKRVGIQANIFGLGVTQMSYW